MGQDNFAEAESILRAHFVQYLRWIHEHTVPVLGVNEPFARQLVTTDIDAIETLADTIAHCMLRTGRAAQIDAYLLHVRSVVPLQGFAFRAAYLRAVWAYFGLNDSATARALLDTLGDPLKWTYREALEFYLDVSGRNLSPLRTLDVANAIIRLSDDAPRTRLQYETVKAGALLMMGEREVATAGLAAALAAVGPEPQTLESWEGLDEAWVLARALHFHGILQSTQVELERADTILVRVPEALLSAKGRASLYLDRGRVKRDLGKFEEAVDNFERANQHESSHVIRIHLAHALAVSGSTTRSHTILEELEAEAVDGRLELERLAALGALAIARADTALAERAIGLLRALNEESPYWSHQRDQLLLELLDFARRPTAIPTKQRQNRIVELIALLNETLELKPNVFGVGLNLNKIIEKALRRFQEE